MHLKSLLIGVVLGVALASGFFFLFGGQIRATTSDAAQALGKSVGDVGSEIEQAGKKLR